MFFKKKNYEIRWTYDDVERHLGKITILIESVKPYKNPFFGPSNSPAAFDYYVPNPIRINGKVVSQEGVNLENHSITFVVTEEEMDEIGAKESGTTIVLWMCSLTRCFKIEK